MTVGNIIGEPIRTFGLADGGSVERKVQELMETVGMSRRYVKRYPHEFSGGQRQRIGIARALAVDPGIYRRRRADFRARRFDPSADYELDERIAGEKIT